MTNISRCSILCLLLLLFIFSGCSSTRVAQSPHFSIEHFRQQIDSLLSDSIFRPVVTSLKIVSLQTSEVMYERNAELLMHPASNMKLLTSAATLLRLGKTFAFTTCLYSDGSVGDGVLHGNLYIKGSGDPDFSSASLTTLLGTLHAQGIRSIDGDIVGDASYFDGERWGSGWMWDDEPSGFAAFNSALSINRNCIEVLATPGDTIGALPHITITPPTLYVSVDNTAMTVSPLLGNSLNISRNYVDHTNSITIRGTLPLNARTKTESVTILGPEFYFITLAKEELQRLGIHLKGTMRLGCVPVSAHQIAIHEQRNDSMIVFMNKVSDNLSAENSLKALSADVLGHNGSTQHGISLVKQTLAAFGIDSSSFLMVDGSGVSHYNLLTSDIYVKLLQGMWNTPAVFDCYYASLPIAGMDGTLENRMRNTAAQNNLRAKTGSIGGVSSLAGYVTTADGEMLAFSMMMQNFMGTSAPYRRAQDAIGTLMANFKRIRYNQ